MTIAGSNYFDRHPRCLMDCVTPHPHHELGLLAGYSETKCYRRDTGTTGATGTPKMGVFELPISFDMRACGPESPSSQKEGSRNVCWSEEHHLLIHVPPPECVNSCWVLKLGS